MPKILMIIAPENFRDEEYFEPKKIFEEEGFSVATASTKTGEIKGMLGGIAKADLMIEDARAEEYDAVLVVGGRGASVFFNDKKLHSLLQSFYKQGKLTTAICVSPTTLANAGLLEGKRATVWADEELIEKLRDRGAKYTGLAITIDGQIVTANGPKAAKEFGREIVNILKGE